MSVVFESNDINEEALINNLLQSGLRHDFNSAIKELIDNSIKSFFLLSNSKEYDLSISNDFNICIQITTNFLRIIDTGCGMDEKVLKVLASLMRSGEVTDNKSNYVSMKGLGALTAFGYLSRTYGDNMINILSKPINNDDYFTLTIDFEKMINDKKFTGTCTPEIAQVKEINHFRDIFRSKLSIPDEDIKHGTIIEIPLINYEECIDTKKILEKCSLDETTIDYTIRDIFTEIDKLKKNMCTYTPNIERVNNNKLQNIYENLNITILEGDKIWDMIADGEITDPIYYANKDLIKSELNKVELWLDYSNKSNKGNKYLLYKEENNNYFSLSSNKNEFNKKPVSVDKLTKQDKICDIVIVHANLSSNLIKDSKKKYPLSNRIEGQELCVPTWLSLNGRLISQVQDFIKRKDYRNFPWYRSSIDIYPTTDGWEHCKQFFNIQKSATSAEQLPTIVSQYIVKNTEQWIKQCDKKGNFKTTLKTNPDEPISKRTTRDKNNQLNTNINEVPFEASQKIDLKSNNDEYKGINRINEISNYIPEVKETQPMKIDNILNQNNSINEISTYIPEVQETQPMKIDNICNQKEDIKQNNSIKGSDLINLIKSKIDIIHPEEINPIYCKIYDLLIQL